MPFENNIFPRSALAFGGGLDLTREEIDATTLDVLVEAARLDNTVVSALTDVRREIGVEDPDFSPWEQLQGTGLEDFWPSFVGVRNREEFDLAQEQVERELRSRQIVGEAGMLGFGLTLGVAMFDLPTLLPGGVAARGGTSALRLAGRVGMASGVAAGAAEVALQRSQAIRTPEESLFAVSGSVMLGGLLGAGLSRSIGKVRFDRMAADIETAIPRVVNDINTMGAAQTRPTDMRLRREGLFQFLKRVPGLNLLLRGEPLIRTVTSNFDETRLAAANLAETPLQWHVNERGESLAPGGSVEQAIKGRRQTELTGLHTDWGRGYAEYYRDGPVGMVGRMTAPGEAWTRHLFDKTGKLTEKEYFVEAGRALSRSDTHPIPQIAEAVRIFRERTLKPAQRELVELGVFEKMEEKPKFAESYATRIYLREKIVRHMEDGTDDDLHTTLVGEFTKKNPDMEAAEIKAAVRETIQSILGLHEGEHHMLPSLTKPTRARVLDVSDEVLEPWLERDLRIIAENYFHSVIPDIELMKRFGTTTMGDAGEKAELTDMTGVFGRITGEYFNKAKAATSQRERKRLELELLADLRDIRGMRDRIRGVYGVPKNPYDIWVRAGKTAKAINFMGMLGGMLLSAIPDVGHVASRGLASGGLGDALAEIATSPRRLLKTKQDLRDFGAFSEWVLNSRVVALNDVTSPYRSGTVFERGLAGGSQLFSRITGMVPWNVAWKSIGTVASMSGMLRAIEAVSLGKATKKQLISLSEAGINRTLAVKISEQFAKHGDRDGRVWIANAGMWGNREAFEAFRNAMSREMDMMVITPGQDKPLFMSTQIGSLLLQFKSFSVSANHRILLSGMQRADADVLTGVLISLALGGMVSDIKATIGGFKQKEGIDFNFDMLDRSGLMGWLMEANALAEVSGLGISRIAGQKLSRFQSRSDLLGLLGPSVDMVANFMAGTNAASQGKLTQGDIGRMMNIIPGNNLFYLLGLFRKMEEGLTELTGARPRQRR